MPREQQSPFVSDGGAGGTLTINVETANNTIGVGETVGFSVHVVDAKGVGAPFVRVFCDSEHGVAIIEPAQNGVSVKKPREL